MERVNGRVGALEKAADQLRSDTDTLKATLARVESALSRIAAADERNIALAEKQAEARVDIVGGLLKSSHVQMILLAVILAILQALGMRIALGDVLPVLPHAQIHGE